MVDDIGTAISFVIFPYCFLIHVNMLYFQMQVATGRYHTLLVHDSSVYSCGSSLCGVLGHGQDTTQCTAFSRLSFPSLSRVINISASHNHAAFITESGEVFDALSIEPSNSFFCITIFPCLAALINIF
jgi:hypothetical protein